jgi:hypothetical protein
MHSISFSQLRIAKCLDQLEAWLNAGETVELRYYKRLVAHFIPAKSRPFPDEVGSGAPHNEEKTTGPIGATAA